MKITVGHLMIVAGVGTYLVMGPLGGFERIDRWRGKAPSAETTVDSAPATPEKKAPADAGVNSLFEEKLPAAEGGGELALPGTRKEAAAPAVPVAPKAAAPVAEEAAKPAVPRRRRTKPTTEAAAPKKNDNLIGVYVALKLANGREVKGALVEQTPSFYKIELPGLGAMSYPVRDVLSIAPAQ